MVAANICLADIREFADMNRDDKASLPDPKPACSMVQVSGRVNHAGFAIPLVARQKEIKGELIA